MPVLILKNIYNEGPGTIQNYLKETNIKYQVIELSAGSKIPRLDIFNTLIVLGGPMSVNDETQFPYLKEEMYVIDKFIQKDKKVFGVCLGAQLVARTLGARVYKGPQEEIGWLDITFTPESKNDKAIHSFLAHPESGAITETHPVFHWHGETFDLPAGAVHLASSELYKNQAFRYSDNVYALQFHIEVTQEIVESFFAPSERQDLKLKMDDDSLYITYLKRAQNFYRALLS